MAKMLTVSGKRIDLLNPDMSQIDIEDIAHHLALINRFTGATAVPYSVAQHSCLVAEVVGFEGLMHDAHEAYIQDISTPVKHALRFFGDLGGESSWDALDELWEGVIAKVFKLDTSPLMRAKVKDADTGLLHDEMRCFHGLTPPVYRFKRIQPWGWRKAKRKFLETYERLNGPR